MSYTFAVVIPPISADNLEAWAALDGQIKQQGERPAIFQKLHDQLTKRYPCLCSLDDDEVDDGVWSDGPLINNFGHRAAVLGLSFDHADEVMPFVVTTANGLGLVVFDWQTETIHRPGQATGMTLQTESGKLIKNVTEAEIRKLIGEEQFAILSVDDNTYMQCSEQDDPPDEYVLEYQDGSLKRHFAATDGPITLERVVEAFVKYLRGDESWKKDFRWEKMTL
jgi:hypothetical protein